MNGDRDERQIVELVDEHYRLVYRFALRLCGSEAEAEDITQQTFLSAHRHLSQLRDRAKARSWLLSITRNAYLKQSRNPKQIHLSALESPPEPSWETPEVEVDEELLRRALDELPEEYRSPLILYYFEELSYRDIADVLAIPIGTVMSRLSRAKNHLRWRLAGSVEDAQPQQDSAAESCGPLETYRSGKGSPRSETP